MNLHLEPTKKRTDETDAEEILEGLRKMGEASFAILLRHPSAEGGEVNRHAQALRLLASHAWNVAKELKEEVARANSR